MNFLQFFIKNIHKTIFLFILLCFYQAILNFKNGLSLQCQDDGFYPHPSDCSKFYRCSHGQRFIFDCAPGTHFNPFMMICDWPLFSGCNPQQQTTPTTSASFSSPQYEQIEPARLRFQQQYGPRFGRNSFDKHNFPRSSSFEKEEAEYAKFDNIPKYYENVQRSTIKPYLKPSTTIARPINRKSERLIQKPLSSNNDNNNSQTTNNNRHHFSPSKLYYDPETGLYHQFHYRPVFRHNPRPQSSSNDDRNNRNPSKQNEYVPSNEYGSRLSDHPKVRDRFQSSHNTNNNNNNANSNDQDESIIVHSGSLTINNPNTNKTNNRSKSFNQSHVIYDDEPLYEYPFMNNKFKNPPPSSSYSVTPEPTLKAPYESDIAKSLKNNDNYHKQQQVPVKTEMPLPHVIYEHNDTDQDLFSQESRTTSQTIQPRKYPDLHDNDDRKEPIFVVDNNNNNLTRRLDSIKNLDKFLDNEPYKNTHALSRREKELNLDNKIKQNETESSTMAAIIPTTEPISNISLTLEKIRDFISNFNPKALFIPNDDENEEILLNIEEGREEEGKQSNLTSSFVVYENETENNFIDELAHLIGLKRINLNDNDDDNNNRKSEIMDESNQISECNDEQQMSDLCSWTPEHTKSNFEWLQVQNYGIQPKRAKLIQQKHTDTLKECQKLCWNLLNNCVGFTYEHQKNYQNCRLVYEIEIDKQIIGKLNDTLNFLERKPRAISGFIRPRLHRIYDHQIVMGENLIPKFSNDNDVEHLMDDLDELSDNLIVSKQRFENISNQQNFTRTFFDCFNMCNNVTANRQFQFNNNCQYVLYYRPTGLCLIQTDQSNSSSLNKTKIDQGKFKLRSGWSIGLKISDDNDRFNDSTNDDDDDDFYREDTAILLQLFERLLIGQDKKFFLGRYLEPKKRLDNALDVKQCRKECRKIGKNQCQFVAVYENLLQQQKSAGNSTFVCLFFSENLKSILMKLMMNEQDNHLRRFDSLLNGNHHNNPDSVYFASSLIQPARRKRENNNIRSESQQNNETMKEMSAYVFDIPEPVLKFRILHRETIVDSVKIVSPSYQQWNNVDNEEKCYKECLNSWIFTNHSTGTIESSNSIFSISSNQSNQCRFLVIESFTGITENSQKQYNCSFFELSPIAFTSQHWYTVRRIPDRFPLDSSSSIEHYFHRSDNHQHAMNMPNNDTIRLLDQITIPLANEEEQQHGIEECLTRCLHSLVFNVSSRNCFKVHIGKLKTGQLKCRFYDRVLSESEMIATSKLFQLNHLPENGSFHSIPSPDGYREFFNKIPIDSRDNLTTNGNNNVSESMIKQILDHYRPLYILNGETNPNNCLRLCILLWGRARNNNDRDRCRLVYAKPISTHTTSINIPKYRCSIYDLNLEQQLNQKRYTFNQIDDYPVKVYQISMANNNYDDEDGRPHPRLIAKLNLSEFATDFSHVHPLNDHQMEKSTHQASYHFSYAQSVQECLETHPRTSSSHNPQPGMIIIAKPMFLVDPILPSRTRVEYECLYYDRNPIQSPLPLAIDDLEAEQSNDPMIKLSAYQMITNETFELVDVEMDQIKFIRDHHRPLIMIGDDNITTIHQCLHRCFQYNKMRSNKFSKCQLVLIEPNRVIQNTTMDLRCTFYNFNVTDGKRSAPGYSLNSRQTESIGFYLLNSTPFMMDHIDPMERFEHINDTDKIYRISETITTGKHRAFEHLTNVTSIKQCLEQCLRTWESKLLYYHNPSILSSSSSSASLVQSNFCRMVIIIPSFSWKSSTNEQQQEYQCSFFETNFTQSLKSFEIRLDSSSLKIHGDIDTLHTTEDDGLYLIMEWPLVSPQVTDKTMLLNRPVDINHCLQECDRKPLDRCQAIITRYEHNRLIKCYFIGRHEYLPDFSQRPTPNHQSKLSVKLFNIGGNPSSRSSSSPSSSSSSSLSLLKHHKQQSNSYLALIDLIRNQYIL